MIAWILQAIGVLCIAFMVLGIIGWIRRIEKRVEAIETGKKAELRKGAGLH